MEKELEKLLQKANGAIDYVIQEAPNLVENFITYKVITSILYLVLLLAMLCSFTYFILKKGSDEYDWLNKDIWFFGKYYGSSGIFIWMIFLILSIFFIIQFFVSIDNLILISIDEKLFLLKYFKR